MGIDRENFIIVQTIDPVETGQELQRIPPHMTVLSWFAISRANIPEIAGALDDLARRHGSVAADAIGAKRVLYGINEDIPAIEMKVQTTAIHDGLKRVVDELGGEYHYPQFARKWGPHMTDEEGSSIQPNQAVHFSSLALFSRQDDQNGKRKVVEHSASLVGH